MKQESVNEKVCICLKVVGYGDETNFQMNINLILYLRESVLGMVKFLESLAKTTFRATADTNAIENY